MVDVFESRFERANMAIAHTTRYCRNPLGVVLFVFLSLLPAVARADLYGFAPLSNNSGQSAELAAQLCVEVTDYGTKSDGTNQVLFTFYNNGMDPYTVDPPDLPIASRIARVFFDDGTLLGISKLIESAGVDFEDPVPGEETLPGGATLVPPFVTTKGFSARKNGVATYGVDPTPAEHLGVVFDLIHDKTFADVLDAISLGFATGGEGSLRIGIHVTGIGTSGDSDAFIMVPTPAAILLGMLGMAVAGLKLRKFA